MTNDELKTLYATFPRGALNAKPLKWYSQLLGVTGRAVTNMFEDMAALDLIVCNLHDGRGYFAPETYEELDAYENFMNAYRCSFGRRIYRIQNAKRRFGAISLLDKANIADPHENAL